MEHRTATSGSRRRRTARRLAVLGLAAVGAAVRALTRVPAGDVEASRYLQTPPNDGLLK